MIYNFEKYVMSLNKLQIIIKYTKIQIRNFFRYETNIKTSIFELH